MSGDNQSNFTRQHLDETARIAELLSEKSIETMIDILCDVRTAGGRLFVLGVGGSAANASHAVNDFRKLTGLESYSPTDNVSEITARVNDDGWESVFEHWLINSKLSSRDCVLVLSVGGGNREKNISVNICEAVDYAKKQGSKLIGIVGRADAYTISHADAFVLIPTVNPDSITPHSESFQEVIWHLMVSHPKLKINKTTW
jgi:D-sedoheptulose 7-phosphate isomerase